MLLFSLVDNGFFYFEEFQNAALQKPPGPLAMKGEAHLTLRMDMFLNVYRVFTQLLTLLGRHN
jgi:hypothetical protein